jgi:hypothetical protein
MIKVIALGFGILMFFFSYSQENTEQNYTLKKGVYRNFQEFVKNNPSFSDTFFTENSNNSGEIFFGTGKIKLKTKSAAGKSEYIKGDIWGFCEGKNVFIRYAKDYYPLLNIGSYSVFAMDYKTYKAGIQYVSGRYLPKHSYTYKLLYALEFNTGKIYRVNQINMSLNILGHDDDLIKAYEKEADKGNNEVMLKYIQEFNNKYPVGF